ncbi:hypothetical protein U8C32_26695 (plasmid) [Sinorhizobium medicae]|uniref:hypothetical protein n=1 Tax=Sinorhizobium medicae TaxID=110321 RepID=UPI002AF6C901|nr:hypothetical protein [Sinorhizobium medicae]WQO48320.1 hypothetical protein U8C42_26950 [Sinorhizobium medicae]WQO68735.1 hypothetical protein U8C40_28205 [Sinorhizobium medicae]WQO75772.1 hypothetical protein U8C31_27740 [Sinorhizobium medicae]WQO94937.1 hypothetical protein U8C32_26695 [Sinorhizobium medicae]
MAEATIFHGYMAQIILAPCRLEFPKPNAAVQNQEIAEIDGIFGDLRQVQIHDATGATDARHTSAFQQKIHL